VAIWQSMQSYVRMDSIPGVRMSETVLIITPTPVEFEAMSRRLARPEERDDDIITARGTIGSVDVVVAMTGKGQESTSAAVSKLLDRTNARYVLLVGVAGGLGDAEPGDVIVPTSVQSLDYGKVEQARFQRRKEYDWVPDLRLVQVATRIAEDSEQKWRAAIRLRRPDEKGPEATHAHIGYAASSNKVIDDPGYLPIVDAMTSATEIMAVEMEAIGAAAAVRLQQTTRAVGLLMIRGISDTPKGSLTHDEGMHARTKWKPYAAEAAAAFTTVLLESLQLQKRRTREGSMSNETDKTERSASPRTEERPRPRERRPSPTQEIRMEGRWSNLTKIIAAIIVAAATIIAAYIGIIRKTPDPAQRAKLSGRVISARDQTPVRGAKVSLELPGDAPLVSYPDGEGTFTFAFPADATSARLWVNAPGFVQYDRRLNLSALAGFEEIRLDPDKTPGKSPDPRQDPPSNRNGSVRGMQMIPPSPVPSPQPAPSSALVDETLRPISGDDGPWTVVIFGGQQDRRADVQSWVREAIEGSGHATVSLFRKVSDEQRLASDLYRGSNDLYTRMQAGRFVSRIIVANLTVISNPATEGLIVGEAKLAVHVLSPSGEMLKSFELSEKGGGLEPESAKRNAINELEAVIKNTLPASI
jgi:nucleoside phosphorylase